MFFPKEIVLYPTSYDNVFEIYFPEGITNQTPCYLPSNEWSVFCLAGEVDWTTIIVCCGTQPPQSIKQFVDENSNSTTGNKYLEVKYIDLGRERTKYYQFITGNVYDMLPEDVSLVPTEEYHFYEQS